MKQKNYLLPLLVVGLISLSGCTSFNDEVDNTTPCIEQSGGNSVIKKLPSGVSVVYQDGVYYYQGDVILTKEQLANLSQYGSLYSPETKLSLVTNRHPATNLPIFPTATTRNLGIIPTDQRHATLWSMVRFVYDPNLSAQQRTIIKTALLDIQAKTNVRFFNATGLPTYNAEYDFYYPYINFRYSGNEDRSSSQIGCVGGKQDINLASFSFEFGNLGVIEHEICHALGMLHEQCRPDRDEYVIINTSNLTDVGKANFAKIKANYTYLGSYDFNSVMGYSSLTSSSSVVLDTNKPMYTKKDGSYIQQGYTLSKKDRHWLNKYYLPYIARSDNYYELDSVVYDSNNDRLSEEKRLNLQARLNQGRTKIPKEGRLPNNF